MNVGKNTAITIRKFVAKIFLGIRSKFNLKCRPSIIEVKWKKSK
jgi:hypothetical protein